MNRTFAHPAIFFLLTCAIGVGAVRVVNGAEPEFLHRGYAEIQCPMSSSPDGQPHPSPSVKFARPDGTVATVDSFRVHDGRRLARAYCDSVGVWHWRSEQDSEVIGEGTFQVLPSELPGKLRKHPSDPHQFAYDNGDWFLHIGDTGYRYVVDTEPHWQAYIDQAAATGFTKIRTWFCRSRGGVEALFDEDRTELDLDYWDEIDRRLLYALRKYPHIQFQLIPFGEDTAELRRYAEGDLMAKRIAQYAQARFSALPNVHWCISNDRHLTQQPELAGNQSSRSVRPSTINLIGRDMAAREPWGTLLTNHQRRFTGYDFVDAEWSDIVTLEDLDAVAGVLIRKFRGHADDPVVNDEDRYELYRAPEDPRYFFRRLMWSSLTSGGHVSYGGLNTYLPFDGRDQPNGIQGYRDAVVTGRLVGGAKDFSNIHQFFRRTGVTLVGLVPETKQLISDQSVTAVADAEAIVAYVANPDGEEAQSASVSNTPASVTIVGLVGPWSISWFNPRTESLIIEGPILSDPRDRSVESPFAGDAVLLLRRVPK